jgi:hypothetical protein
MKLFFDFWALLCDVKLFQKDFSLPRFTSTPSIRKQHLH